MDTPTKRVSPRPSLVSSKVGPKKVLADRMTCIQCGRERALSMARSDQFCGQRCITTWEETHKQAVNQDASSNTPGNLNRVLKNLHIDMARPGTKLKTDSEAEESAAEKSDSEENSDVGAEKTSGPVATRSSLINSIANMISQSQKETGSSKALARNISPSLLSASAAKAQDPTPSKPATTPAKVAAKRSSNVNLASSAKKVKLSKTTLQSTPKSVSFNLKPEENGTTKSSSPTPSNVLPLIASMFQPKKPHDSQKIKIPSSKCL